jgi:hypothetical protein
MKRIVVWTTAFLLCVWLAGESLAGGSKWSQRPAGGNINGSARGGTISRHWKPSAPVAPYYPYHFHRRPYYPYYFYGHNPRSIIIITPSPYYSPYSAPATVVTSEPYYCHMHHVGFVSRVGFLDHVSGTHKIPLETVNSICTDSNESCVVEGY